MNNHKKPCRYNDQIHCSHCGKQWDINDTDIPECLPVKLTPQQQIAKLRKVLAQ